MNSVECINNMQVCDKCGEHNYDGVNVCQECGKLLSDFKYSFCNICGTKNSVEDIVCNECKITL